MIEIGKVGHATKSFTHPIIQTILSLLQPLIKHFIPIILLIPNLH
jgi:hypothetical protein